MEISLNVDIKEGRKTGRRTGGPAEISRGKLPQNNNVRVRCAQHVH